MQEQADRPAVNQVPEPAPSSEGASPQPVVPVKPPSPTFRQRLTAFLCWFHESENLVVCGIALAVLILHVLLINTPKQAVPTPEWIHDRQVHNQDSSKPDAPAQYIFDEEHYIQEAIRFLHREPADAEHGIVRGEHPPLAKWIIASGIIIFGDNPIGWRSTAIPFGIAGIFVFYFICRRLVRSGPEGSGTGENGPPEKWWVRWIRASIVFPVFATFIFAFENLSFIQGGIAMLDVYYVTFMLLGIFFYLRTNYVASGVFLGLSMLCKAMTVLPIAGLGFHYLFTHRDEIWAELKYTWNALRGRKGTPQARSPVLNLVRYAVAIPVVWVVGLTLLEFAVTHSWANPITRTKTMLTSHLGLNFNAPGTSPTGIATRPWQWLFYPGGITYWYSPHFLGSISWTLWALIMPSFLFLVFDMFRVKWGHLKESWKTFTTAAASFFKAPVAASRAAGGVISEFLRVRDNPVATFGVTWFVSVFVFLVILELFTQRYMYHFYFYPAVPAVSLAIAWGLWRFWEVGRKGKKLRVVVLSVAGFYVLATIATFVIMSPFGSNLVKLPSF